jgi:hypothetical protein
MSGLVRNLKKGIILDPRMDINDEKVFGIDRVPLALTYQKLPVNAPSLSNLIWDVVIPSNDTFVERDFVVGCQFQVTATGADQGSPLFELGTNDAPRQYPLNTVVLSAQITINGQSITGQPQKYIHELSRIEMCGDKQSFDYSGFPSFPDTFQTYHQGIASNRNPLGSIQDSTYYGGMLRGSYQVDSAVAGGTGNINTSEVVTFTVYEPIQLSPFLAGLEAYKQDGFYNIDNMQITLTLDSGNLTRCWSHNAVDGNTFATFSATILGSPILYYTTMQKNSYVQGIPSVVPYNYRIINPQPFQGGSVAPLGNVPSVQVSNTNIQQIPDMVVIFARRQDPDLNYTTSDSYFRINQFQLNWNGQSSLLANASPYQLWQISASNGLKMSYQDWYNNSGSILVLKPKDLGLYDYQAPNSVNQQSNFQITLNITNINPTDTITYQVWTVFIYSGVAWIGEGQMKTQQTFVTDSDVKSAHQFPKLIKHSEPYSIFGGSAGGLSWDQFYKGLRKGIREVGEISKEAYPIRELIFGKGVKKGRRTKGRIMLGGCEEDDEDDYVEGGEMITKEELRSRLR